VHGLACLGLQQLVTLVPGWTSVSVPKVKMSHDWLLQTLSIAGPARGCDFILAFRLEVRGSVHMRIDSADLRCSCLSRPSYNLGGCRWLTSTWDT